MIDRTNIHFLRPKVESNARGFEVLQFRL